MARRDADMTEGNIWMHMLHFSVPMAIGLLFQQLYNTVDTIVVGQFVGQQQERANQQCIEGGTARMTMRDSASRYIRPSRSHFCSA